MGWKETGPTPFTETSIIFSNDPGKGIQLGNPGTWNPATGVTAIDFGWRDITAPISVRGVAATDPSWSRIDSTNFWGFKFSVADYVWLTFHIPHDIVPSSDIHFHMHWFPAAQTSPLDTGYVTWEFEYAYAKGFNQAAFDFAHTTSPEINSGIVYATDQVPASNYQHMVTETAAVTIPDLTEPDGIIHVRVGRVNNQTSPMNNAAVDIFGLTADIHYQTTNLATKQKSPDFYAD